MANEINVTIAEEPIIVTLEASGGDMFKSIYDTNNNGIVDKAESIDDGNGHVKTAEEIYDHINNVEKHRVMNYIPEYKSWLIEE